MEKERKQAYFIGIGGIGVSALARKYLLEGWEVVGSDRANSRITQELEKLGARIVLEQKAENISADLDLVIYTIAVSDDHPELARARELQLKVQSYPEALGELSRTHYTIAIAGTHGKTTTTAMIAKIMQAAGLDPTVIVGSLLAESGTNFIAGKSKPARLDGRSVGYLVVEACEYRRSFLHLSPQILVITNIDNDHLDYYRDLADIQSAFEELKNKLPADGKLITEQEYSKITRHFSLQVPGAHNVKNAQAALAVAEALGVDYVVAVEALESFRGTWRRFEYKGEMASGAKVYDDYAHHPTEIRATLAAARELAGKNKIFAVFQPHLYSRTKLLFSELATSFGDANETIIAPVYAAREVVDPEVSSEKLAQAAGAKYLPDFSTIADYLKQETKTGDLVIAMGAGDISALPEHLL